MGGMSEANDSKVNLDVPEHLEYSDEHVWVDSSVEPAMVGVTEYATEQFGELVYIDLPEVGTQVEAGDEVAEFESSKAVTALVSPVAGTIRYVNNEAADDPSIVTDDPYGKSWIFKIELEDDEPDLLPALTSMPRLWLTQSHGRLVFITAAAGGCDARHTQGRSAGLTGRTSRRPAHLYGKCLAGP